MTNVPYELIIGCFRQTQGTLHIRPPLIESAYRRHGIQFPQPFTGSAFAFWVPASIAAVHIDHQTKDLWSLTGILDGLANEATHSRQTTKINITPRATDNSTMIGFPSFSSPRFSNMGRCVAESGLWTYMRDNLEERGELAECTSLR